MKLTPCKCETPRAFYSGKHDATFCGECLEWLESRCSDELCEYCKDRPVLGDMDDEKTVGKARNKER